MLSKSLSFLLVSSVRLIISALSHLLSAVTFFTHSFVVSPSSALRLLIASPVTRFISLLSRFLRRPPSVNQSLVISQSSLFLAQSSTSLRQRFVSPTNPLQSVLNRAIHQSQSGLSLFR